jgi:hypothetical protein
MIFVPFVAGDDHETVIELGELARAAVASVGADGTVEGTTGFDGREDGPMPVPLIARTRKVYAVPFTSPVMEHSVVPPDHVHVSEPGVLQA